MIFYVALYMCGSFALLVALHLIDWHRRGCVDITREARAICLAAYGVALPKSVRLVVYGDADAKVRKRERYLSNVMRCGGIRILGVAHKESIEIFRDSHIHAAHECELHTLVHEILHHLQPTWNHDRSAYDYFDFDMVVQSAVKRLWEAAEPELRRES